MRGGVNLRSNEVFVSMVDSSRDVCRCRASLGARGSGTYGGMDEGVAVRAVQGVAQEVGSLCRRRSLDSAHGPDTTLPPAISPFEVLFRPKPRTRLDTTTPPMNGGIAGPELNDFVEERKISF